MKTCPTCSQVTDKYTEGLVKARLATSQERQRDIINQILRHTTQDMKIIGALLLADIIPEYRAGFVKLIALLYEIQTTTDSMPRKTEN